MGSVWDPWRSRVGVSLSKDNGSVGFKGGRIGTWANLVLMSVDYQSAHMVLLFLLFDLGSPAMSAPSAAARLAHLSTLTASRGSTGSALRGKNHAALTAIQHRAIVHLSP